jgi:hypothetical protein
MDAVNAVPVMADPNRRQRVIEQLYEEYGPAFDAGPAGHDNWTIVDTCIELGAVPELVTVLKFVGEESAQWRRLDALVQELFPSVIDDELDRLVRAGLDGVPRETAKIAIRHHAFSSYRSLAPEDPGTAVDVYERLRTQADPFPLLTYLEVITHDLEDRYAVVELHRLIDDLALRSGLTRRVRALCRSLRPGPPSPPRRSSRSASTEKVLITMTALEAT